MRLALCELEEEVVLLKSCQFSFFFYLNWMTTSFMLFINIVPQGSDKNKRVYQVPFGLQRAGVFQSSLLLKNERLVSLLDAIFPCEISSSATSTPTEAATSGAAAAMATIQNIETSGTKKTSDEDLAPAETAIATAAESRAQGESMCGESVDERRSWHLLGRSVVMATPGAAEQ